MLRRVLVPLLFITAVFTFLACQTAPYTGRKQLILLSEDQEMQLGLQAWQEVVSGSRPSSNQAWVAMVRACGERIAAVADAPDYQWEFTVIADPQVNAFALPGGKVAFYEGILPICGDETGVAVVMGHEIAHAIARHGNERISRGMVAQGIAEIGAAALGGEDPQTRQMVYQGFGLGLQYMEVLPFSRSQESEADHIGIILMAKAGYDPRRAPEFWERMRDLTGGNATPEFLSTHPLAETRIRQLREWLPEALEFYRAASSGQR